ncbi:MAG: hypothetical protein ACFFCS_13040, partial [Candidatus Hodarchaeota archaeon]
MTPNENLVDYALGCIKEVGKFPFPEKIKKKILLGFDGFVDNLYSVVDHVDANGTFKMMDSMKKWAERIWNATGSSASMERVLKRQTTGGFTCNVGKAIAPLCGNS